MPIVAMALISAGYILLYWGIDNVIAWRSSDEYESGASSLSNGTDAVELAVLAGLPYQHRENTSQNVLGGFHEVPFPYHPTKSSGQIRPIGDSGNGTGTAPPVTPPNPNPIRQV